MIKEILEWASENIKPQEGTYEAKPDDAKSLFGWIKAGKIPVDCTKVTYYLMSDGKNGYGYYREDEVRDMTPGELLEYEVVMAEKEKEREEVKKAKDEAKKVDAATRKQLQEQILAEIAAGTYVPHCTPQDMSKFVGAKIIALDTETTGFSPEKGDELLQVSIVGVKGPLFNSYLKPHVKKEWEGAMKVNKITPRDVANAPYPEYVRGYVQEVIDSANFIVGFNTKFDVNFLRKCMGITIPDEKVVDSMEIFKLDEPYLPNHKLMDAVNLYASDYIKEAYAAGAHDALTDAMATMDVFKKQYKMHAQK